MGDELVVTSAPALGHQRIVTRLVASLHFYLSTDHAGEVFAGPVDVLLHEGDHLEPDLASSPPTVRTS